MDDSGSSTEPIDHAKLKDTAEYYETHDASAELEGAEYEAPERSRPVVLIAPTAADAKRVGLYLHEDDYKALLRAKADDGADANARIRAMIAIWRASPRFRTQVARLARTASKDR